MLKLGKSVRITHFLVRSFYFVLIATAVLSVVFYKFHSIQTLIATLWATMPIGAAALICLDRLMCNLKKHIVFDFKNVRLLNILSILCFIASVIAMVSFIIIVIINWDYDNFWFIILIHAMFPIMSIGEFFVGLIVRVVKASFEDAILIKYENDLTI